ncbi:MAG: hypothetical protein ABSE49_23270 [Polyangiaceae bacterium]|jgi:hypothetical protein
MSHSSSYRSSLLVAVAALTFGAFGCASSPTPPPVASAPPSQAFTQAAGGVTAPQGNAEDGVQFVEQEHKDPTIQGDGPATKLGTSAAAKPNQ